MKDSDRRELVTYRLQKAKETISEIEFHLRNEFWNTSVNRMYYACFYAVSALLINDEIKAQTHAGVRQMFGLHFVKTGKIEIELGKFYSDIFDKRMSSDYEDFMEFEKEEVLELYTQANQFITRIIQLLDLEV